MRRREFITLLGSGAVAWPLAARAQQPLPVIGFLRSTPADPFTKLVEALRRGLKEMGFVEGQNLVIEQRYADNHLDRLPGLASDLVSRKVAVIIANSLAAEAARAATETIPIVFVTADDPVTRGLVTSLNRPAGNLTGLTFFGGGKLGAKRLELLHELVPRATVIGLLMDPNWPGAVAELPELEAAGDTIGAQIVVVRASDERDFENAFAKIMLSGAGALMIAGSPFFTSRRRTLVALAARHAIPAIYDVRENVEAGGLISYSASFTDAYRQAGVYAGRILKGAKPSELPVLQPTTFELTLNLKTAKALGLTIPSSIMVQADEVIE
jgi:putative tryptophan/tyrosine transport system substrate-binding protein